MPWEVEVTEQFADWYRSEVPSEDVQAIGDAIDELRFRRSRTRPTTCGHRSRVATSKHEGASCSVACNPIRTFFAFDPRCIARLLVAAGKTSDTRFYERMILLADDLYEEHLSEIGEDQYG